MKLQTYQAKYRFRYGAERWIRGEFLVYEKDEAKALEKAKGCIHRDFTSINTDFVLHDLTVTPYEAPKRNRLRLETYDEAVC